VNRIRILENFHIPLWLIKDLCWALVFKPLGVIMIFPTVGLSFYLSWKTRNSPKEWLPNLSVTCWILANSSWMLEEFFSWPLKIMACFLFVMGIILISVWLFKYFPYIWVQQSENIENRD